MQENQSNATEQEMKEAILNSDVTDQSNPSQESTGQPDPKRLKRQGLKEEFKKKSEELDEQNKPPMTKEDTVKFYNENIPFMKLQDDYEDLMFRFHERKIKNLELQVREIQALGFLAEFKASQDEANKRKENEDKMKEEWEKMTDEERAGHIAKAKANMKLMDLQAKGTVKYDGENNGDIMGFVTGEIHDNVILEDQQTKKLTFSIQGQEGPIELSMLPGQSITRTPAGEFIVTE